MYVSESYQLRMIMCPGKHIPPNICDYNYDDEYIIAMQLPDTVTFEFKKNTKLSDVRYWIRFNAKGALYGPLTKKEFDSVRKALNVPKKLELDEKSIHVYN